MRGKTLQNKVTQITEGKPLRVADAITELNSQKNDRRLNICFMPTLSIFKSGSGRHQDLASLKSGTGSPSIPGGAFYRPLKSRRDWGGVGRGRSRQLQRNRERRWSALEGDDRDRDRDREETETERVHACTRMHTHTK